MCGVEKGHEIITKILAFKILDGPLAQWVARNRQ